MPGVVEIKYYLISNKDERLIVGTEALYPMVGLCQRCSLGSRREGGSLAEKALLLSIFGKLTQKTL